MKSKQLALSAALAASLFAACASRPVGGTNDQSAEGQTLGGYVATGAIDPANGDKARPVGDDDKTPTGSPAATANDGEKKSTTTDDKKPPV